MTVSTPLTKESNLFLYILQQYLLPRLAQLELLPRLILVHLKILEVNNELSREEFS